MEVGLGPNYDCSAKEKKKAKTDQNYIHHKIKNKLN
jgi:hypothetical protein